jgi:streptogramin lyase
LHLVLPAGARDVETLVLALRSKVVRWLIVAIAVWGSVCVGAARGAAVEVVRDGLSSLQTTTSDGQGSEVWVARGYPAALGRFDGRRLHWTPVPLSAGRDGVHLSNGPGAVWFVGGQTAGRLVRASGVVQTFPMTVAGPNEFSDVAAAADGSAWVLEGAVVLHHVAEGVDDRFAVFAEEGGPLSVAQDGRLWFGQRPGVDGHGGIGIIDASGRQQRIALPYNTRLTALLPTGTDRMLVATANGHLLEYRAGRLVAHVREPGSFGALVRDRRDRLWATRFSASLLGLGQQPRPRPPGYVRLDDRLRAGRPVLLQAPVDRGVTGVTGPVGLAVGPGASLWSVTRNGTALTRLTTRARDCRVTRLVGLTPISARRMAAEHGCRLRSTGHGAIVADQSVDPGRVRPPGALITVRLASHVGPRCTLPRGAQVVARGAAGSLIAVLGSRIFPGPYLGCASRAHRIVRLAFTDSFDDSGSSDTLSAFQLQGRFAVAKRLSVQSHYGNSTVGLVAFDLVSGRRLAAITVGAQLYSQPELTLSEYRANASRDLLYTLITTTPDGARSQQLRLERNGQTTSLASGPPGSITGLSLTNTTATWTQDNQRHTAGLPNPTMASRARTR